MPLIFLPVSVPIGGSFWITYINGTASTNDQSRAVIGVDGDGVYSSGYYRGGAGNNKGLQLKYDLDGNQVWSYLQDLGQNEAYDGVSHDGSAAYFSGGTVGARVRGMIAKRQSNGTVSWEKRVTDATENMQLFGHVQNGTHMYVTGTNRNVSNIQDLYLGKFLCSDGSLVWDRALGDSGNLTNEGGAGSPVFSGSDIVFCGIDSNSDWVLVSYDSSGNLNWQRSLNVGATSLARSVSIDSSGNIYLVGSAIISSYFRGLIFKFNSSGTLLWQRRIDSGASSTLRVEGIHIDGNNIYLAGNEDSVGAGLNSGFVIRMNTSGSEVYAERLRYSTGRDVYFSGVHVVGGALTAAGFWEGDPTPPSFDNLTVRFPIDQSLYGTYATNWIYEDQTGNFTYTTPTYSESASSFVSNPVTRTVDNAASSVSSVIGHQKIAIV